MQMNTTTVSLRHIPLILIFYTGIISIITSGCGGGSGTPAPGEFITGSLLGKCTDMITGLGEDGVGAILRRPLIAPKDLNSGDFQELTLPTSEIVASTTTIGGGYYEFKEVPVNETYFISYDKVDFLDEAYFEVTVEQNTTKTLEPVTLIKTQFNTIRGIISGSVADAETGDPIQFAIVRLREGINNQTGTILQEVTTDTNGNYEIDGLEAGNYTLEASQSTYQTAYFDALVLDVDSDSTTDDVTVVGTIALVPDSLAGSSYSVSGTVFAAYNKDDGTGPFPLGAASVQLREGIDTTEGTVTSDGFTDSSGLYGFSSVLTGQYTLEGGLEGAFNPGFIDFTVGSNLDNQNVTLIPLLPEESEQITIVLTWGTTRNLDGALFELEPEQAAASWLNDDSDGYGPETSLLELVELDKLYAYLVRDALGGLLSTSKAQVRVYRGNHLRFTFELPLSDPDVEDATDSDWVVFTINKNTIVPVNDLGSRLTIADATASENDPDSEFVVNVLEFDLWLSFVSNDNIQLDMVTEDGTATAGVDYEDSNFEYSIDDGQSWIPADGDNGTVVTIPAGNKFIKVRVPTIPDYEEEDDETFILRVSEVIQGSIANFFDIGTGTIENDDPPIVW